MRKTGKKKNGVDLSDKEIRFVVEATGENGSTVRFYAKNYEDARKEASSMSASCQYDFINVMSKRMYVMRSVMDILAAHMDDEEHDERDATEFVAYMMANDKSMEPFAKALSEEDVIDLVANVNDLLHEEEEAEEEVTEKTGDAPVPLGEFLDKLFDDLHDMVKGI